MRKHISRGSREESWATAQGKTLPQRGGRRGQRRGSRGSRRRPGLRPAPRQPAADQHGPGSRRGLWGAGGGLWPRLSWLCRRARLSHHLPVQEGTPYLLHLGPLSLGTGPSGVSHGVLGHPEETGASPSGRDSCGRGGGSLLWEGGHGCQGGAGGRGVSRVPSAAYGSGHQRARSSRLCPPARLTENRGQGCAENAAGDCPVLGRCSINGHCRDAGGESPCWVHLLTHLATGVQCQPATRSVPRVDSPANTGLRAEASRGAARTHR